jgi:hypothetical protein
MTVAFNEDGGANHRTGTRRKSPLLFRANRPRKGIMQESTQRPHVIMRAKLTVTTATGGAATILLSPANPTLLAAVIAVFATAGTIEIGCRLTLPHGALNAGVVILVAVLVLVIYLASRAGISQIGIGAMVAVGSATAALRRLAHGHRPQPEPAA